MEMIYIFGECMIETVLNPCTNSAVRWLPENAPRPWP